MKKKIFLCGKVKELDFAKPELFELEMRRDVTVFLKQKNVVNFQVFVDQAKKEVSFKWPIGIKEDYKHDLDSDPQKIREEFIYYITGGYTPGFTPQFPNTYYHWRLDDFYNFYRELSKHFKASRFKDIKFKKQPTIIELILTF